MPYKDKNAFLKWKISNPNYYKIWKEKHPNYDKMWYLKHPNYQKEYRKKHFLSCLLHSMHHRCTQSHHHYYKRGIKNFLTIEDLKNLWQRDKGYLLKQPSINRKDRDKNYYFDNCEFVEKVENDREGGRITCKTLSRKSA